MTKKSAGMVFIAFVMVVMLGSFVSAGLLGDIGGWFKKLFVKNTGEELGGELKSVSPGGSGLGGSGDYRCEEGARRCELMPSRTVNFRYRINECKNDLWIDGVYCEINQECLKGVCVLSCVRCPDLNNDGIINSQDSLLFYGCVGNGSCPDNYDLNNDGIISILSDIDCIFENVNISADVIPECNLESCSDGTVYGNCSLTKPQYCDGGVLINNCQVCGCEQDYGCEADGSCAEGQIFSNNQKNMLKYSNKEAFLVSDKNWKDVLPLIPLTVWTGQEDCQKGFDTAFDVCSYPILIYHSEETLDFEFPGTSLESPVSQSVYSVNGKSLVRVYLDEKSKEQFLKENLDVASVGEDYVDVVLNKKEKDYFEDYGYDLETIPINNPFAKKEGYELESGYHSYDSMVDELNSLSEKFPDISVLYELGQSIENRSILAMKISDNPSLDEDETKILVAGNHHAREIMTVEVPIFMINYFLVGYDKDAGIKEIVDNNELWFVPMANPDGHVIVETTDPYWRKNARDNNGDGVINYEDGVDLNRNYGYTWGYDDYGSSPDPSSSSYRGTEAFSEPETRAIRDLVLENNFSYVLDYHSYGGYILYPWGHIYGGTPDNAEFKDIANRFNEFLKYPESHIGQIFDVMYYSNGDSIDWHYGEQTEKNKIMAFGFELNPEGGFAPDESYIQPTSEKQTMVLLDLLGYPIGFSAEESVDADSVIHFLQQFQTDKIKYIGGIPQELADVLVASPPLGVGIQNDQEHLSVLEISDYLDYWETYEEVVYVEDNYELALLAASYASLINSPLIIQGTELDVEGNFIGKNVICVGDVIVGGGCYEQYALEELQENYLDKTKTKKIILTNPDDLNIFASDILGVDKTSGEVSDLYGKTSLVSAILASSKHELILTDKSNNFYDVDENFGDFFEDTYNEIIEWCLFSEGCADGFENTPVDMLGARNSITFFLSGKADLLIEDVDFPSSVFVDEVTPINVEIMNLGFDKAENVVLDVYEINESMEGPTPGGGGGGGGKPYSSYSGEFILIESVEIGDILEDNVGIIEVNWTPTKVGSTLLWFNVSTTSNESNLENNDGTEYVFVQGPAPDVEVSVDYSSRMLVNEINKFNVSVENIGTLPALNTEVSFYNIDYSGLVLRIFDEGANESVFVKEEWHNVRIRGIFYEGTAVISIGDIEKTVHSYTDYLFGDLEVSVGGVWISFNPEINSSIELQFGNPNILIENRIIGSLEPGEKQDFIFEFTPTESKWYDFLVKAEIDQDIDLGNNEEHFSAEASSGIPELSYWYTTYPYPVILNQETTINLTIWNNGFEPALNSVIDFYIQNPGEKDFILIESQEIGEINENSKVVSFDSTPNELGWYQIILNITYEYSGGDGNKQIWAGYDSKLPGADISLWFNIEDIELGQEAFAEVYLYNEGSEIAENISVYFYDNDELIESMDLVNPLEPSYSTDWDVFWTPEGIGGHELKVRVECEGDIDLSNNEYTRTLQVYKLRNITFELMNNTAGYVNRYLGIGYDWDEPERVELVTESSLFSVPDKGTDFWIINTENIVDENIEYVLTKFIDSDLHDKMFVISEDYKEVREEQGKRLYRIYANEVFWNYGHSSFELYYPDYNVLGTSPDNLTIYYCGNWDFEYEMCLSGWTEAYWTYKDIEGNEIRINTDVSSSTSSVEAYALGEPLVGGASSFGEEKGRSKEIDFSKIQEEYENRQKFLYDEVEPGFSGLWHELRIPGFFYDCEEGSVDIFLNNEFFNSVGVECYDGLPSFDVDTELGYFEYSGLKNITLNFNGSLIFQDPSVLMELFKEGSLIELKEEDSSGVGTIGVDSFGASGNSEFILENHNYTYFVANVKSKVGLSNLNVYINGRLVGEIDLINSNGEKGRGFAVPSDMLGDGEFNISLEPQDAGLFYTAEVVMKTDFDAYYLTVVASPDAIPFEFNQIEADFQSYGNLDDERDREGEFAVGRIMGLTISDVSSYLSRILFYNQLERDGGAVIIMEGDHSSQGIPVRTCGTGFCPCYFDYECPELFERYAEFFDPYITCNQDLIDGVAQEYPGECGGDRTWLKEGILQDSSISVYADHGYSSGWPGFIDSDELEDFDPQFMYSFACSTCAYASEKTDLFCANTIRHGATGYIGGVRNIYGHHFLDDFLDEILFNNQSIGYAFKMAKNKESRKDWLTPNVEGAEYLADEYGVHDLLIGDPSFKGGVGK